MNNFIPGMTKIKIWEELVRAEIHVSASYKADGAQKIRGDYMFQYIFLKYRSIWG